MRHLSPILSAILLGPSLSMAGPPGSGEPQWARIGFEHFQERVEASRLRPGQTIGNVDRRLRSDRALILGNSVGAKDGYANLSLAVKASQSLSKGAAIAVVSGGERAGGGPGRFYLHTLRSGSSTYEMGRQHDRGIKFDENVSAVVDSQRTLLTGSLAGLEDRKFTFAIPNAPTTEPGRQPKNRFGRILRGGRTLLGQALAFGGKKIFSGGEALNFGKAFDAVIGAGTFSSAPVAGTGIALAAAKTGTGLGSAIGLGVVGGMGAPLVAFPALFGGALAGGVVLRGTGRLINEAGLSLLPRDQTPKTSEMIGPKWR